MGLQLLLLHKRGKDQKTEQPHHENGDISSQDPWSLCGRGEGKRAKKGRGELGNRHHIRSLLARSQHSPDCRHAAGTGSKPWSGSLQEVRPVEPSGEGSLAGSGVRRESE